MCNMKTDENQLLEHQIVAQLTELERQIGDLSGQREQLQKLLINVRRKNLSRHDVTRKNSIDRIIIENRILEVVRIASASVSVKRLYSEARSVNPKLKSTTFRSYLHRLKEKGF